MKKGVLSLVCFVLSVLNLSADKMNVLLIIADDQGYGELSCNGNPYLYTPNIDKFSKESYNFTNYHSGTTCAPTRAGIMTGMYSNKVGVWHTIMGRSLLKRNQETIAEKFAKNDYATGLFGKWHLGDNYPYRPMDRGFQRALWFKGGALGQSSDYWGNNSFDDTYFNKSTPEKIEGFSIDVFTDRAISFMRENQEGNKPFFCYLALNAPHMPFSVETKYAQKFVANKKIPNPNYYASIEKIDEVFGKLEAFLKESGLAENTIVIFTTDNGSAFGARIDKRINTVIGYNAGMRDKKGSVYEGGHRVPFLMRVPTATSAVIPQLAGYIDVAPTLYDICEIDYGNDLDGISLKIVLDDTCLTLDRYLVVDTQRQEGLSKDKPSVVMRDLFRLVDRKELYDLDSDPFQQNDIASANEEIVAKLLKDHDEYWESIAGEGDIMQAIYLKAPDEESVVLSTHDRHISCFWDQAMQIRGNRKTSPEGFWYVNVPEDGEYSFELSRWAFESNLNLKDEAPAVPAVKGTTIDSLPAGYAFKDISGAELIIGDISLAISLDEGDNPQYISFENIKLKKGEYKLFANFFLKNDKMGAHYVRVLKKP